MFIDKFYKATSKPELREDIQVTELCYDCLRRGYYMHKFKLEFYNSKTLLKPLIGKALHEFPILANHKPELKGIALND